MYTNQTTVEPQLPITVPLLQEKKKKREKIVALTAYDASFAERLDTAGVDLVLVGDSLGMVLQGHASTLPVSIDDMVYHTAAVARGLRNALLVADLPFMSYSAVPNSIAAAARLLAEASAAMVKLEGAGYVLDSIHALSERGIPVCAHLGLTPQSVHKMGGYRVQGKDQTAAERLMADARAVEQAGADLLVLECIPASVAKQISETLRIPTIGIGAGIDCDGQILVLYDMLGITRGKRPRFSKDFLAGQNSIGEAISSYVHAVRNLEFPALEHSF